MFIMVLVVSVKYNFMKLLAVVSFKKSAALSPAHHHHHHHHHHYNR